ncbi:hypothetical protein LZ554_004655 [Drepanopeziza brunnea f. sp. 'monogermtubi']|nr:hypothetical protein LZ554_004655 [Drepanopeziza brunnea f. sp. 'monogermtubi']
MAPAAARHETALDGADDKTLMPYGTRGSSKRKAAEISSAPSAPLPAASAPKASTRSSKTKAAAQKATLSTEPRQPSEKKHRSSPTLPPDDPSSRSSAIQPADGQILEDNSVNGDDQIHSPIPEAGDQVPGSSATPGPDADSLSQPIPDLQVDPPSESSGDVQDSSILEDDVPEAELANGMGISGAGRGRGRGRASPRGRGSLRGRGSRGGRVSKAAAVVRGGKTVTPSARGRGGGRGRGGRRKKPEDPVIDVLYKRKAELKAQYKAIASMQRDALIALAEKSLVAAMADPFFHEALPEFEEVTETLKGEFEKCIAANDKELEQKAGLTKRTMEYNQYIVEQQYRLRMEEVKEQYEARLMEQANYIYYKKTKNERDIDEIPFPNGEDGRIVKQSAPPPKRVHGTGHPFMDPGKAVSNARSTHGDNDYEQHPANWWEAKSKKEKAAILRKQAENVAERERLQRGDRRKKGGRQALFQPNAQQETAEGGEAAAEPEDDAEEKPEEEVVEAPAESLPPTVPGSPDDETEPNVNEDADSDARPQETDEYGVSIPHKRVRRDQPPPYNRIQASAPVEFEPHEIGLRQTHYQKQPDGTHKKLGRDIDPNPKNGKVYYDQRQGRYNAGKNQPEDLDQEIVAAHNLHPRLGLPIAGSVNPRHDECPEPYFPKPTDWTQPWENSNPVMFVHTALDGTRSISRTSRSEWMYRAQRAFDQLPLAEKMGDLLDQSGDREARLATPSIPSSPIARSSPVVPSSPIVISSPISPSSPIAPSPPRVIADDLVSAVNQAADEQAAEILRAAEVERLSRARAAPQPMYSPGQPQTPYVNSPQVAYSPPSGFNPQNLGFSPPQPTPMGPPPIPPPRSIGYDPVRDRTYVTPYIRDRVSPPRRPAAHATFANGGNLSELANAADFFGSRPPHGAYGAPLNPYENMPMPISQQQRLSGLTGFPGGGVVGFSQHQMGSYGPPPPPSSRGGGGGGLGGPRGGRAPARELRPAPPSAGGSGQHPQQQQQRPQPQQHQPQQQQPPLLYRGWSGYGQ